MGPANGRKARIELSSKVLDTYGAHFDDVILTHQLSHFPLGNEPFEFPLPATHPTTTSTDTTPRNRRKTQADAVSRNVPRGGLAGPRGVQAAARGPLQTLVRAQHKMRV